MSDPYIVPVGTSLVVIGDRYGNPIPKVKRLPDRTPAQVRARFLRSLDDRLEIAESIADGRLPLDDGRYLPTDAKERLAALRLLGQIGGAAGVEVGAGQVVVNISGGVVLGSQGPVDTLGSPENAATGQPAASNAIVEGLGEVT